MHISLLTLNVVTGAAFVAMFGVFIQAYRLQFVSRFWDGLRPETETNTYFFVMWLAATIAGGCALLDVTVIQAVATMARSAMAQESTASIIGGAFGFSLWLTTTAAASLFSVGCAVAVGWDWLRKLLKLPAPAQIVG